MELSDVKKRYIDFIDKIILNDRVSHSYLIEVDNYDDDYYFVLSFVKMILCNVTYDNIDNSNKIIQLIDSANYPDLFVLEPDGNTFKKSQLVDLKKEFLNSSLLGGKRIYIIKYAEKFNLASANTLLKFLEEPEDNIIALILTNNRYNVLDTILSRCQVLSLKESLYDYELDDNIIFLLKCFYKPSDFFVKFNYIFNNIFTDKDSFIKYMDIIKKIFVSYLHYDYGIINSFDDSIIDIFKDISNKRIFSYLQIIESDFKLLEYNINFKIFLDSFYAKLILEVI